MQVKVEIRASYLNVLMFLVVYLQRLHHGRFWRTHIYPHPMTCKVHPGNDWTWGIVKCLSNREGSDAICRSDDTNESWCPEGPGGGRKEEGQSCVVFNCSQISGSTSVPLQGKDWAAPQLCNLWSTDTVSDASWSIKGYTPRYRSLHWAPNGGRRWGSDGSMRVICKVLSTVFYLSNQFTNPIMFGII